MEENSASVSVKEESTCMVYPASPPPRDPMDLPPLDAFWYEFHYNRRLLFYSVDPSCFPSVVETLKQSLSQALVPFYPWSGRLARIDGRFVIDFSKEAERSGVEFVVASSNVSYRQLLEDGFQIQPFFDDLCKWSRHEQSQIYDMPLLSIQVTKFKDGGMSLAYAQSHVVADGHSMWHFMQSWSECARELGISMPPLHQREVFVIDNPSKELATSPFDCAQSNTVNDVDDGDDNNLSKQDPTPMIQMTFHFTFGMIQRLKELASQEGKYGPFTSYEVLCAHFWKHVVKARSLKPSCCVYFTVLANCRKRVTPPLPSSYFGNCINYAIEKASVGEILTENLTTTTARIHNAVVRSSSESSLVGFNHWLALHNNSLIQNMPIIKREHHMMVASSSHFPCYEVDFGLTGRPDVVRTTLVKGDGEMVLFPGRNKNGSIDICMPLKPYAMNMLLQDHDFLKF